MLREVLTSTLFAFVVLIPDGTSKLYGQTRSAKSPDPPMPPKCGNATPKDDDLEDLKTEIGHNLVELFLYEGRMVPLYNCTLEAMALNHTFNVTDTEHLSFLGDLSPQERAQADTVAVMLYTQFGDYPNNTVHWGCNLENITLYYPLRKGVCIVVTNKTTQVHPRFVLMH
ncbi:unnamed protein product [Cylicocyclus nassatus]|uniref:Uncharacterized protein n=1 Tax=Cylicocyclus nassatus TaxID=53992 RepID=A0AA36GG03_CYLNA|nr:unnamed protein product [Cylicocyclus nassatus]